MILSDIELKAAEVAVMSPNFSHSRAGSGCWREIIWIYHFDSKSPSGVTLEFGGPATQLEPLLRKRAGASPLSPTEPR